MARWSKGNFCKIAISLIERTPDDKTSPGFRENRSWKPERVARKLPLMLIRSVHKVASTLPSFLFLIGVCFAVIANETVRYDRPVRSMEGVGCRKQPISFLIRMGGSLSAMAICYQSLSCDFITSTRSPEGPRGRFLLERDLHGGRQSGN
jgi:hypothetical protein